MNFTRKKTKNLLAIITIALISSIIISNTAFASTEPDPSDYTINRIPADFIDISATGFSLTLGDQQGITGIPIGFDFNFYGIPHNTVTVTSNGYITFSNLVGSFNTPLPTTQLPDNIIAPFWDYLNPSLSATGGVYFQTIGIAPGRKFIVQWNTVPMVSDPLSVLTFEVILFEGNNEIQFHYSGMTDGYGQELSGPASGSSASIGIENADGTRGREVSFNQDGIVSSGSAFSFTLAGNAFEAGRLLGDLDNDDDITILDQSVLTDIITGEGTPHSSIDLLLADTSPQHGTENRAFGDGIIDESDHDTIFEVMMGRQVLNPLLSGISFFIAPPGETVLLYGSGFDCEISNNNVIFTDINGNTVNVFPDQIITGCEELAVTIPAGLDFITSVQVEKDSLLSNPISFYLEGTPVITSLSPDGGKPGDIIRVRGFEFGFAPGDNLVHFNGTQGTVTGVSNANFPNELSVRVPSGVTTGPVTVTVGGNISNEVLFSVDGPPVVSIDSPASDSEITGPVDVIGTVFDYKLAHYTLEYAPAGEVEYITLSTGTSPVNNGVLGHFDPTTLLNGMYSIRLRAADEDGNVSIATALYRVKGKMKIGHFTVSFVDLEVPVAGMPITITRTYDSRNKRNDDFGYGWSLGVSSIEVETNGSMGTGWFGSVMPGPMGNYCIQPSREHNVSIRFPDGQLFEFKPVLAPSCQIGTITAVHVAYVPLSGTDAVLSSNYDDYNPGYYNVLVDNSYPDGIHLMDFYFNDYNPSLYYLTLPDGREFAIHTVNGIQQIKDLNGNTLIMSPNGITSINETVPGSSKGVAFERDADGRITGIFDPAGNGMSYTYDAAGDLVAFTDREENTTQYEYHPDFPHYLEQIRDPLGRTAVRNEYYDDGRLKSHTDEFGNTVTYNHDIEGRQEVITDQLGNIRVYHYDERGNIIREIQPDGMVIDRQFDARDNRIYETESYDISNPPFPVPAIHSEYDEKDNLLWTENALGHRTTYTYNEFNQVLTTEDPMGNWTINTYDGYGNLLNQIIRKGAIDGLVVTQTEYEYDSQGNILTQTEMVNGDERVTRFEYDPQGNTTKEIEPDNNETIFTYDSNGNQLSSSKNRTIYACTNEGCTSAGMQTLITRYEYDKMGRPIKTFDPGDPASVYTESVYDAIGRQIETYDKLRRKTTFEYDRYDDPIHWNKKIFPDNTYEEYGYNALDQYIRYRDRGGRIVSYEYNKSGKLLKTISPPLEDGGQAAVVENQYNSAGRLIRTIDANGNLTEYEYDAAGRRIKLHQYMDVTILTTIFDYDENGNQTSVTDPKGNLTLFEYDALNRLVKTIFPPDLDGSEQTSIETVYDEFGRRIIETDQAGKSTRYEYNDSDYLTKVIQKLGNTDILTSYGYDEAGNNITQTDAEGRVTWFQYDEQGREIARILPGVDGIFAIETKTYYLDGNMATHTDFMGRTTTYTYSICCNRLESRMYENGDSIVFTYTPSGKRASVTDNRGTTFYSYDNHDNLTNVTYPGGNIFHYIYDLNGNCTAMTTDIGGTELTTLYKYDGLNRLTFVTDPAGRIYNHSYDENSNPAAIDYPNGIRTEYTFDNINRLIKIKSELPQTHIQSYDFILDSTGFRTRIIEHQGTQQERTLNYIYDDLSRLTEENVMSNDLSLMYRKTFTYDNTGNRLSQTTIPGPAAPPYIVAGDNTYGYDPRDRLILQDGKIFGWDENGNLTSTAGDSTYTWDDEQRLIGIAKSDGTGIQYVYDADGNRIQTTTAIPGQPPREVNFLLDVSEGLHHVIAELDDQGDLTAYYVRGSSLLSVMRPFADNWSTRFYHTDGIDSVRILTDEEGAITDTYTYTAFGELIEHTGSDTQPYAFSGEPFDADTGFQYHRSRWLDVEAGRWVSMDTWQGDQENPVTLHKYIYGNLNPVNAVDRTGFFASIGGMMAMTSMMNTLAAISVPNLRNAIRCPKKTKVIQPGQRIRSDKHNNAGGTSGGRVFDMKIEPFKENWNGLQVDEHLTEKKNTCGSHLGTLQPCANEGGFSRFTVGAPDPPLPGKKNIFYDWHLNAFYPDSFPFKYSCKVECVQTYSCPGCGKIGTHKVTYTYKREKSGHTYIEVKKK